jgi:hypothetical protein
VTRIARLGWIILSIATACVACTGDGKDLESPRPQAPSCTNEGATCGLEVETRGVRYEVACLPVAEAWVDIDLPREPGQPRIKAIAGVAWSQGVAVWWNDPGGCGLWALALADGLTPGTATSIRDEVERGVERFGVTASPMPDDVAEG